MLRSWIYMALIAIVFAVGSSDAAECTSMQFNQELNTAELAIGEISLEEFQKSNKEQLIKKIMALSNNTIVSFDYTVTVKNSVASVDYKILLACNETTTTVLPDGTKKTTQVVSSADTSKVETAVKTGL